MPGTSTCPKCGSKLPSNAPRGICPICLLAAGLESQEGLKSEAPKTDSGAPTASNPAGGVRFEPPTAQELAERFKHLDIIELLGLGGMGAVYKARQTSLDRVVALKIIRPEATQHPNFAQRFTREAKALARLSHPNIVTVHDFGYLAAPTGADQPEPPFYYIVMEYVDGANLRQVMQSGELLPEQALSIVPQICDALQFAHEEGVVHRDIKPENILLDRRGRVKIADFGLAKIATNAPDDPTLTATHQVMGTPRYMAPEQLEGAHVVDHRADIYSLGVVFYEMLTGQIPAGHFDPPSKKVQVDIRLDEVVLKALAHEPERRYQHASDLKTDVQSCKSSPIGPSRTRSNSSSRNSAALEADWSSWWAERPDWQISAVQALYGAFALVWCLCIFAFRLQTAIASPTVSRLGIGEIGYPFAWFRVCASPAGDHYFDFNFWVAVYLASAAIGLGLIDQIKTYKPAAKRRFFFPSTIVVAGIVLTALIFAGLMFGTTMSYARHAGEQSRRLGQEIAVVEDVSSAFYSVDAVEADRTSYFVVLLAATAIAYAVPQIIALARTRLVREIMLHLKDRS